MPSHVRKGDMVIVTSGFYKGEIGTVVRVMPADRQVVVKGVNVRTRHVKPSRTNPQGGIMTKEMPLHMSKVSPVVDGKPTRVRFETRPDGSKVRVAVRNGQELSVVHGPRTRSGDGAVPGRTRQAETAGRPRPAKAAAVAGGAPAAKAADAARRGTKPTARGGKAGGPGASGKGGRGPAGSKGAAGQSEMRRAVSRRPAGGNKGG